MTRFLVNRDFARLWFGQAVSSVGDFVFSTTLMIWVARVIMGHSRWAPAAASGLMLCAVLAILVVGPVAGVFVDRWNRRRTMLNSEVIRGVLVLGLWLVTLIPRSSLSTSLLLPLVYFAVFAVNSVGQFFNPARFSTIGDIVPADEDRTRAFGVSQATAASAAILGPPLAAPLLFSFGVKWALLFNAASYAVSFLAINTVHFPSGPQAPREGDRKPSWPTEFRAGVAVFRSSRFLVALLAISVVSQLGTGCINSLNIFFVQENLHANVNLLGVLSMAVGLGSIVGSLASGRIVKRINIRQLTWMGLLASGSLFGLYARQTNFAAGLVMTFIFMIPVAAFNTGLSPLLLKAAPPGYTGRVVAVLMPISTAAAMLSMVLSGWFASTSLRTFHGVLFGLHFGRIDAIYTVSALLVISAGVFAFFVLPPIEEDVTKQVSEPEAAELAELAAADTQPAELVPADARAGELAVAGAQAESDLEAETR
jgi:MFS family permease